MRYVTEKISAKRRTYFSFGFFLFFEYTQTKFSSPRRNVNVKQLILLEWINKIEGIIENIETNFCIIEFD